MINILFYSIFCWCNAPRSSTVALAKLCYPHTYPRSYMITHLSHSTYYQFEYFYYSFVFFLFWWETLNTMLWLLVNTVENLGFFEKNCSGFTTRVSLYRLIVDSHRKEKGYSWLKGYNILSHWVYISRAHKLLAWNFQHFPTIAHRLWWSISQPQTTSWKSFVSFRHNCQKKPLELCSNDNFGP